jgi:hypothetical protein
MHKVREVIVPVQVGAVKIYVATTMEPLRKKGKKKDRVKLRNHQN